MSVEDISGAFKERLNSAIFGTYTLYLFVFNWRVFVFAFSNLEVHTKIQHIDDTLGQTFWNNIVWALGLTAITVFGIPPIRNWYESWLANRNFNLEKRKNELSRNLERLNYESELAIYNVTSFDNKLEASQNRLKGLLEAMEVAKLKATATNNPTLKEFFSTQPQQVSEVTAVIGGLRECIRKLEKDTRDLRKDVERRQNNEKA